MQKKTNKDSKNAISHLKDKDYHIKQFTKSKWLTIDKIYEDIHNKLPPPFHFHSFFKESTNQIKT